MLFFLGNSIQWKWNNLFLQPWWEFTQSTYHWTGTHHGSHGIVPKRDWTHFLKIGFMVAGGGFYSYYNLEGIKLDKGKKIKKKNQFYAYKKHLTQFLKMDSIPVWVQFHTYLTPQIIKAERIKATIFDIAFHSRK